MADGADPVRTAPQNPNPEELPMDRVHSLVMDQQNSAHVIETSEADLAEHLRTQSTEFSLVQLKANLMDFFHGLTIVIDQGRYASGILMFGIPNHATESVNILIFLVSHKSEISRQHEARIDPTASPEEIDKHMDVMSMFITFQKMQRQVGIEEV
ncbi:hypothetical protein AbraIFM66951_011584 [Aspergillus brasiliensis]|uniref:Uncharacterized protein n=1 Tax=Aspergillus brasiliensis TaxID=319629 RepID=A0A9W5YS10_9EURO|nr:hypothetical protein AbraCBS73388_006858 [Aspergillus brasiliensis]GKZ41840.1 hypothetical protein AbraIFM66951_011584 [Aspergillus brasiliensis]